MEYPVGFFRFEYWKKKFKFLLNLFFCLYWSFHHYPPPPIILSSTFGRHLASYLRDVGQATCTRVRHYLADVSSFKAHHQAILPLPHGPFLPTDCSVASLLCFMNTLSVLPVFEILLCPCFDTIMMKLKYCKSENIWLWKSYCIFKRLQEIWFRLQLMTSLPIF